MVGLDGAWVSDFAKQGAIADLSALMAEAKYDSSQLASQIQIKGKTYMIPVVNFVYPLFVNNDLLAEGGGHDAPGTRTEFLDAAKKISALGGNVKGWALPLDTAVPNGIQNDVMSWLWASGGSMLTQDGKPDLTSAGGQEHRRVRQEPERRRRHRARIAHHEGAGQGREVHHRPGRHDDRLAGAHHADQEEQSES